MKDGIDDGRKPESSKSNFKNAFMSKMEKDAVANIEPVKIEKRIGSVVYRMDSTGNDKQDELMLDSMIRSMNLDENTVKTLIKKWTTFISNYNPLHNYDPLPGIMLSHQNDSNGEKNILIDMTRESVYVQKKSAVSIESLLEESVKNGKCTKYLSIVTIILMVTSLAVSICLVRCNSNPKQYRESTSADSLIASYSKKGS